MAAAVRPRTGLKEAERRLARIRELYEDNCRVVKRDVWSEQALGFAKKIARGELRIVYPTFSDVIDQDDPLLEYVQMFHNIREMYPSRRVRRRPAALRRVARTQQEVCL